MNTLRLQSQIKCLHLLILLGLPLAAFAQTPLPVVRAQIARIAEQLETLQSDRNQLLRENRKLTDRINATKRKLQKSGNRLIERELQNNLAASRELADRIQKLDQRIYALTEDSVSKKKELVGGLNTEIDRLSREAETAKDAKRKRQLFSQILRWQKEVETYRAQITTETNELLLGLDITLGETDGPDEIQQKLAIVQDQQDLIAAKIRRLDQQIRETRKKLSLQRNMLELLRDIRRGEDDEFDLDRNLRIAELEEDIADAEATLEIIEAKRASWQAKEKVIDEKAKRFAEEVEKFLKEPKGKSL
jgi:chromosome segregation ATPase